MLSRKSMKSKLAASSIVVTLSLYAYFLSALLGRQFVQHPPNATGSGKYEEPDMYFPVFTTLQV
ncbi:hypothetical protein PV327_011523 [Microctonus hyperodae]|uniref:Bestrophin homolog n=1 Tax=Microctonus hyperodae TaxID=165561 RepID=A0AA39C2T0_MICHY|nr:hypothetical protein PV327_011523 [Microctonus hyperodae]